MSPVERQGQGLFDRVHFVLLNQFYPPGVFPTGVVLEAVAEALVARGHEVTVVAGRSSALSGQQEGGAHAPPRVTPGAPRGAGGPVKVVRLWSPGWGRRKSALGKLLSYLFYYLGIAWWVFLQRWRRLGRADVIVALTSPPYLSLLARMGAWWHGGRR